MKPVPGVLGQYGLLLFGLIGTFMPKDTVAGHEWPTLYAAAIVIWVMREIEAERREKE